MSVRVKIFICLVGVGLLLWLATAYLATRIFVGDFEALDNQRIIKNVNRVFGTLSDSQQRVSNAANIWAQTAFSDSEAKNEFVRTLMDADQVSLLVTFGPTGQLLSLYSDHNNNPLGNSGLSRGDSALIASLIQKSKETEAPVTGLVESDLGPLLFSANAVKSGPKTGNGIFAATLLDKNYARMLQQRLLMAVQMVPVTEALLAEFPFGADSVSLSSENGADSTLMGVKLLKDIHGNPVLALEVVATKEISVTGKRNLQVFLGVTAAIGILLIILGTLLVDFWVGGRIRRLTQSARHADQYGMMEDLPKNFTRVPDEISQLAQTTRRMVERIRSSQTLYRAVIETQTEMIVRYKPDGTIFFTNEAFAKWLNLHPKSVLDANLHTLFSGRCLNHNDLKKDLNSTRRQRKTILTTHDKEGNKRLLEWNESGVFDSQRKLTEIQAMGRDITEQLEYEAKLREARDHAETADRAKGEFLAVLGHETRTPLTSILGFSSILDETPLSEEQREYVSLIRSSGNALLVLLNDILDYTRIAAGQIDLHPKTLQVSEVLKEVIGIHLIEASVKSLPLDTEIEDDAPRWIEADEVRLKQILSNLLGNAIKFTSSGSVYIKVKTGAPGFINFVVRDTGVGIPVEKRDQLFKPFSQLRSALSRDTGGTGIGLASSKRLVELMGGTITDIPQSSPGACFQVHLPIGTPIRLDSQITSPTTPENDLTDYDIASGIKILLVEDNKVNQKLAVRLLAKIGHSCDVANDGVECLEMTASKDYDIIFLDIQMPRMDGFEAIRQIREREKKSNSPSRAYVVALTAFTLPGDSEKCFQAGMDNFVGKPIRAQSLEAAIETWRGETFALHAG